MCFVSLKSDAGLVGEVNPDVDLSYGVSNMAPENKLPLSTSIVCVSFDKAVKAMKVITSFWQVGSLLEFLVLQIPWKQLFAVLRTLFMEQRRLQLKVVYQWLKSLLLRRK